MPPTRLPSTRRGAPEVSCWTSRRPRVRSHRTDTQRSCGPLSDLSKALGGRWPTRLSSAFHAAPSMPSSRPRRPHRAQVRLDHLVYSVPAAVCGRRFENERTGVKPLVRRRASQPRDATVWCARRRRVPLRSCAATPRSPTPPRPVDGHGVARQPTDHAHVGDLVRPRRQMAAAVSKARGAGYDPGDVEDFSRAKPDGSVLRWSLSYRHYTRAQMGPGAGTPFLIDWKGAATPAATAPTGCESSRCAPRRSTSTPSRSTCARSASSRPTWSCDKGRPIGWWRREYAARPGRVLEFW